ncbi:hypothetical protein RSOLAG1IB_06606 [Rhizoctonia solani AG-1 IB]|uniref:N-acetyltransferase domain-containing protein n=1 Tax=Thanatephorus cucumeris (strain AG1-IB / isolate 7/3/14) TaxID=1108050 RepID=A0A0B7F8E7_THACB|nr:hypothetical protein RSOLAG1IB_06606 [Rhizoctonia solani AG-1 IB]
MNTNTFNTNDFDIELLEAQGGNISSERFDQFVAQLKKNHLLDHIGQPGPESALGELDVVYILLQKGYITEIDMDGKFIYTNVMKEETDYWLAGFGCLRFPSAYRGDKNTADVTISLLPRAQKRGGGSLLLKKLLQHAFDTLRIHRVTASITCPIQPSHSAEEKKQILFNTKQLCWIFERFGFKFEGVTRGTVQSPAVAAEGGVPVWHDVHRLSMLLIDYLGEGATPILSNSPITIKGIRKPAIEKSPWESMLQRHEEENNEMKSWTAEPRVMLSAEDGYNDEDDSDDETVQGGDSDSDWEIPEDFDG